MGENIDMKRILETPRHPPLGQFGQRAKEILARIQPDLLPDHAREVVAINVENGEYTLGPTTVEAGAAFRKRWPNAFPYFIRADGGPVVKFHGK
jgi:hypothetical protein